MLSQTILSTPAILVATNSASVPDSSFPLLNELVLQSTLRLFLPSEVDLENLVHEISAKEKHSERLLFLDYYFCLLVHRSVLCPQGHLLASAFALGWEDVCEKISARRMNKRLHACTNFDDLNDIIVRDGGVWAISPLS
jgi:hypothetical protein